MICQQKTLTDSLWPMRRDAMQVLSFRVKPAADSKGRGNNPSLLVYFSQIAQSSRMIVVSVRDKNIVYRTKVDIQKLRVIDKHIADSRVEQYPTLSCLQQDRQSMLRLQEAVAAPIIRQYRPLHAPLS